MTLDVVICTHNPRPAILGRVLAALARQTADPSTFEVLLVDNASLPPVPEEVLEPLGERRIHGRRVTEPSPGLMRARLRALCETRGEWLLFVDDDNELSDDFVAEGLRFAAEHPEVGAFGGRLRLPADLDPPAWIAPFLPYLGVRDEGDEVILGCSEAWGPWEPPGAGLFVRRDVATAYAQRSASDERSLLLGRRGASGLASCDDAFLVRQAPRLGLQTAYLPALCLVHHLAPDRFRYRYLIRLLAAFGNSLALLDVLVRGAVSTPPHYRGRLRSLLTLWHGFRTGRRKSYRFALAQVAYHAAAARTWARLAREGRS